VASSSAGTIVVTNEALYPVQTFSVGVLKPTFVTLIP